MRFVHAALAACLALAGCDALLGIEPWRVTPGAGGGGEGGAAEGGGGGASTSTTAGGEGGEGGASCVGAEERCDGGCVDLSTSSAHCGACGHSCFGGACAAGECAVAALADEGFVGGARVASNAAWIAWTAPGGTVRALRKADAQLETMASGLSAIRALDGQGPSFVFADSADSNGNARVHRAEPGAGLPTIIAQGPDANAQDLEIDGTTVFSAGGGTTSTLGVYAFPLNGVASTPALVCGNSVSVSSTDLAVDAAYVFFRRGGGGNLAHVCSKSGGSATAVSQNAVGALTADASGVYFAYGSTIYRRAFPLQGEEVFVTAPSTVLDLEISAGRLAWRSGTRVFVADKVQGATPILIATEATNLADVALDDDGVYWITNQGGVRALALPAPG